MDYQMMSSSNLRDPGHHIDSQQPTILFTNSEADNDIDETQSHNEIFIQTKGTVNHQQSNTVNGKQMMSFST